MTDPRVWSQADLESAGAFTEPIKGCRYVLHTASPVVMAPPKGKVRHAVQVPSCSEGRLAHPLKLLICSCHNESSQQASTQALHAACNRVTSWYVRKRQCMHRGVKAGRPVRPWVCLSQRALLFKSCFVSTPPVTSSGPDGKVRRRV